MIVVLCPPWAAIFRMAASTLRAIFTSFDAYCISGRKCSSIGGLTLICWASSNLSAHPLAELDLAPSHLAMEVAPIGAADRDTSPRTGPLLLRSLLATPLIYEIRPLQVESGGSIEIIGTNLLSATLVELNGQALRFGVHILPGALIADIPTNATSGVVRVVTPSGAAAAPELLTVVQPGAPIIHSIEPMSGAPDTAAVIHGENLHTVTAVKLAGKDVPFDWIGWLNVWIPPDAASGHFTVITRGGEAVSKDLFTVLPPVPPVISAFSPLEGAPGMRVKIAGQKLKNVQSVLFNGVKARFEQMVEVELDAYVPTNATSGPITVELPGFAVTSSSDFRILTPQPSLTFASSWGVLGGRMQLIGRDLRFATHILFNGVAAEFTVSNTSFLGDELWATVPLDAQSGTVTIQTPYGELTTPFSVVIFLESDLNVGLENNKTPILLGTTFSSSLAVTNLGPSEAKDVVLFLDISPTVQWLSLQGAPAAVEEKLGRFRVELGNLPPGQVVDLTLTLQATHLGQFLASASVTTTTPDPFRLNNASYRLRHIVTDLDRPILQIHPMPEGFPERVQFALSWTGDTTGYVLQTTRSLSPNPLWVDYPLPQGVLGIGIPRSITVTNDQAQFFRLTRP